MIYATRASTVQRYDNFEPTLRPSAAKPECNKRGEVRASPLSRLASCVVCLKSPSATIVAGPRKAAGWDHWQEVEPRPATVQQSES